MVAASTSWVPRQPRQPRRPLACLGRAALIACAATRTVLAADPVPYTVAITGAPDPALDRALHDASNLERLRANAPVGPFALVTRAQEDAGRLKTVLESAGYYASRIDVRVAGRPLDDAGLPDALAAAPAAPPVPVAVAVVPGPLFHLRRVEVQGAVPAEDRAKLDLAPGAPAVAADVLAAGGRLLDALRASGHALAKVGTPEAVLVPGAQALDVTYKADPGPRVSLGDISLDGLERVNAGFVRRRLLVHPGKPYSPASIEDARQDLASLGVFSTVRAQLGTTLDAEGRIPLAFDVTERKRHAVGVTASYSTDLGASVALTWSHRNLFGNAEQLNLGAAVTQLGGGTSTRGFGYNASAQLIKPDFLRRDQSLQLDVAALKENLDAYDRTALTAGATLNRKIGKRWTASLGVTAVEEQVTQEGTTRDYTLIGLPVGLRYDSTNSLFDPTEGIRAAATVTPTASLTGTTSEFVLIQLSGSTYLDLARFGFAAPGRSVLAVRGLVGSAQGASTFQLPPDQRFYAGGGGTVRGYRYQSIGPQFPDRRPTGGTAVTAGSVEYRQRFGGSFGAVAFVDAGQVSTDSAPGTGALRVGTGVGARYYTAVGPIRLDVAVPLNKRRGDDTFELYIGLGQAF